MRVADLVTASVIMLLGGVVVYDAVRLGIGWGTDGPKGGFFPFWLGVLLLVMCAGPSRRRCGRSLGRSPRASSSGQS
jgi:hypothetical protein